MSSRCLLSSALLAAAACGCDGVEGPLVHTAGSGSSAPAAGFTPDLSWQAQLSGEVDPKLDVTLFYLDADSQSEATLDELRALGKRTLCYLSAGTHEPWRDDADEFPDAALGNPLANYPSERWLDPRDTTVRALMQARIERLAVAGCEGVLPANLSAHLADSGFALTSSDAIDFASFLSSALHARGLSAGLSIAADLLPGLLPEFDWALAVDCLEQNACAGYQPVRAAGKPVLLIEFGDESDVSTVCPAAAELGFHALIKRPDLGSFRVPCPD